MITRTPGLSPTDVAPDSDMAIPRSAPSRHKPARQPWQELLAAGVGSVGELLESLHISPDRLNADERARGDFPLRVPRGFVDRMRRGDADDPLLRQVLPSGEELRFVPGFTRDPLSEDHAAPLPGLLHKFRNRVLLIATGACAVHCRYCFRRHFPYGDHQPWTSNWRAVLDYIAASPEIDEVILSGGDPLAITDDKLRRLAEDLSAIAHLRRLRVHSRMPIVLPQRVDEHLLAWLAGSRLQPVLVVHANHANEIDHQVVAAMERLRSARVTVLNQAVLLRGVNDSAARLAHLSEALFAAGVLPYYLNLLDPVAGAAHFAVGEERARQIVWDLMTRLPGYLVPRLVREAPGAPAKLPIAVSPQSASL